MIREAKRKGKMDQEPSPESQEHRTRALRASPETEELEGDKGQRENLADEYTGHLLTHAPSALNASKMMSSDSISTKTLITTSGEDQACSTSSSHSSAGLCFPQLLAKAEYLVN